VKKYRVEIFDLNKSYRGFKNFDCGNSMINRFVQKNLKKRVKKHLSQAYVLLENDKFIGFYTLDSFSIIRDDFKEYKISALPPSVPVIKLGMLGIDKSKQHQGLGKRLLRDAFLRIIEISKLAGCAGIYLLAEEEAIPFYKSLGFKPLKRDLVPLPMFLNIETILNIS
jgi:GNAT superfamily N-acetyltransferase